MERRPLLGSARALRVAMQSRLWSVILAAGSGRRLAGVTGGTPKQFWRPGGRESLVEQTLTRLLPLCPSDRTVAVVADSQREHVRSWGSAGGRARVVFQPEDRGTAAGVLIGLVPVLSADPDAVVLISPSDHGVGDADAFRRGILDVLSHLQQNDSIVLLGVEPSAAQADYGWITLHSSEASNSVRPVTGFVEKPAVSTARRLLSAGAVWNTMVIVARARTLFELCREQLPDVTSVFADCLTLPRGSHHEYLVERYRHLRVSDFSRDVLMPAQALSVFVWPASMGWSDLGTPERLARWLKARSSLGTELEHTSVAS